MSLAIGFSNPVKSHGIEHKKSFASVDKPFSDIRYLKSGRNENSHSGIFNRFPDLPIDNKEELVLSWFRSIKGCKF